MTASIPAQMTQDMRQRLHDAGYTDAEIRQMTPSQAWENLGGVPSEPTMLDAALEYVHRLGWFIHPLIPGTKEPITKHGKDDATTDEQQIRLWWKRWPDANIAVNCGRSGLCAVDLDTKHEQDGPGEWRRLLDETAITKPDTATNLTPSAGEHEIYRLPDGVSIPSKNGIVAPGVDTKSTGGYIVLPPSNISDRYAIKKGCSPGGYAWEVSNHPLDTPPALMPDAMVELLLERLNRTHRDNGQQAGEYQGTFVLPDVIEQSNPSRDKTLYRFGCSLRAKGMTKNEIYAALVIANRRCVPPMTEKDLRRITDSVCKHEPGTSYSIPEPPPWVATEPPSAGDVATETPGQDAAEKQDGWEVWTVADAYKPRKPVEYIVGDLLPLPSLSIVYSPPGGMKTMLLADMAACVAGGKPWLEPLPDKLENTTRATKQAAVLWADFDNGPRTMHERIEAAARARNLAPDAPLFYMSMPSPWLDMSDWQSVQLLIRRATSLDAKLVIIDNLSDVCGSTEENSAAMGTVMSNFRRVAEETAAAVVVVHHQRKVSGVKGRTGDTLRGHSSILAAIDLALCIAREEHSDEITMEATKVRGADVYPFGAVFTYEHKPGTSELASYRFFGTIPTGGKSKAAIRRTVLETVKLKPGINKTNCVDTVRELHDVGINRVRSEIEYLIGRGKLAVKKGGHNAFLLSIPSDDPYDSVG